MTPEAAAKIRDKAARMKEEMSGFEALITRLACIINERPDLSRLAGVTDTTLAIERVGDRWPLAVADLIGLPFRGDPWLDLSELKARSVTAIGRGRRRVREVR
jgi:hypothetical protein